MDDEISCDNASGPYQMRRGRRGSLWKGCRYDVGWGIRNFTVGRGVIEEKLQVLVR